MTLKELNVGNYVYADSSHEIFEIQIIYSREYQNWQNDYENDITGNYPENIDEYNNMYNVYLTDMSPIFLDAKTLPMVGFKVYQRHGAFIIWEKGDFKLINGIFSGNAWMKPIVHMHQLQNLYQATTGETLTIKK